MGQTIACANQKGGVGKTTTVVNLGSYLALAGERVLVVDLDPQGNATSGLGLDRNVDRTLGSTTPSSMASTIDELIVRRSARGSGRRAVGHRARRRRSRACARSRAGSAAWSDCSADVTDRLRLHPRRLPAVARAIDRQRADRRRFRAHPVAMRVLRPGRTDPAAGHARPHSRSPQPRPGHQGRRPDDVRRPDEPVRGRRGRVRRHLGTACSRRSSRGTSACPRHRATVCRSRSTPRIRPARSRTRRSPTSCGHESDELDAARHGSGCDGGRRDGPPRASPGPRSRPRLAHPAASRRPAGHHRDPDRRGSARIRISRASASTPRASRRLTASIAEHGVLQPILVTERSTATSSSPASAAFAPPQPAGLDRIPAVVRQLADREQLELALVENLQREDLDPIETADAYRQLIDEFGFSQDELADTGRPSPIDGGQHAAPARPRPGVQAAVADGRLTEGHGRALGGLARRAAGSRARLGASARSCPSGRPRSSFGACASRSQSPAARRHADADPDLERVEEDLRRALGTKVSLARSRRGGRIVIEYYSDEELGRLYERLTGGTA